jgi:hypothetical protein
VSVETCDEAIAQENDQLKLEVKRHEQMVSELVKQAKMWPSQDNRINMVNKLEKGSNVTKQASQQSKGSTSQEVTKDYWRGKAWVFKECILECKKASHQEWHWLLDGR